MLSSQPVKMITFGINVIVQCKCVYKYIIKKAHNIMQYHNVFRKIGCSDENGYCMQHKCLRYMDLNTVLSIKNVTCTKGVIHYGVCGRGMLRHIRSPSLRGLFCLQEATIHL